MPKLYSNALDAAEAALAAEAQARRAQAHDFRRLNACYKAMCRAAEAQDRAHLARMNAEDAAEAAGSRYLHASDRYWQAIEEAPVDVRISFEALIGI